MVSSLLLLISYWFACIITCYHIIRPLSTKLVRIILTLALCILISYVSCQNLPLLSASSILIVGSCWFISIRLVHLTVFSKETSFTFRSFSFQILRIIFPILPSKSVKNQWPILSQLILLLIKLLINHWAYRLFIQCNIRHTYAKTLMFYPYQMILSYIFDVQMVLVRILTRNQYTLESFTNFPIFSLSLREFWGQRYNRFVSTVLRESVFQPIQHECSSRTIGGLTAFIVSGLFHAHVVYVCFDDRSLVFPSFIFFFLHGIVCGLEVNLKVQLPKPVGWLVTHAFLLITAPLLLETSIKEGSSFMLLNSPPLFNVEWIPKLPVTYFCPE